LNTSDALWEIFKTTGHIGAYILFKDYGAMENPGQEGFSDELQNKISKSG
jgi:hypothetical protein